MSALDTSELFNELVGSYKRAKGAVEVDFRKLIHWVKLGDQLTHLIHPYPAKLIPHIAHFFVRARLSSKGGPVLDPFCGSGTVALEASLAGARPLIADSNPLALLVARVKTWPYNTDQLQSQLGRVIESAQSIAAAPEIPIVNAPLWYSAKNKKCLERLALAIAQLNADQEEIDFFRVCLSVTARRLSFADPHISVPVRLKSADRRSIQANRAIAERLKWLQSVEPFGEFKKVCEGNLSRVRQTNERFPRRRAANEVGSDARLLQRSVAVSRRMAKESIRLTVTSPPYGSAQKYIRASSLSLNWIGLASPRGLAELESGSIGREHVHRSAHVVLPSNLPVAFETFLDHVDKRNPARGRIARLYLHEMRDAVREMVRVTADGGRIVLVIGNNQVCGLPMRNDIYLTDVMSRLGMKLELSLTDTIKSRGLMTKRNKTASVIARESVLVFKKG